MQWTVEGSAGSVFFSVSLWFFVCAWNIPGTAERICTKFSRKACLVPRLDEFEAQCQRSEVKVTRDKRRHILTLSAACMRFVSGKTSWSLVFNELVKIDITHVTKASVRETAGCPPLYSLIQGIWLCFFGHMVWGDSKQNHHTVRRFDHHIETTTTTSLEKALRVPTYHLANIGSPIASIANTRMLWWRIIDGNAPSWVHYCGRRRHQTDQVVMYFGQLEWDKSGILIISCVLVHPSYSDACFWKLMS